jgi:hypothetical protein
VTKISQLSSIGDSLAIGDQFLIRDIDDAGSPNKSVTVSGITRALADGDATAPALAFAADKNTGIYRAGTDSLAVATNGIGRLFVDADGALTVTRTGLSGNLATFNGQNGLFQINSTRTTGGSYSQIAGTYGGNATDFWRIGSLAFADGSFAIWAGAGAQERLRIDSSGRVGIGTSSPDERLHVKATGTQRVDLAKFELAGQRSLLVQGQWGAMDIGTSNGILQYTSGNLGFRTSASGNANMLLDISGRVGIGTTSPSGKLTVDTGNAATNAILVGASAETGRTYGLGVNASAAFVIHEHTAASDRLVIDSSGRLLVGTSSSTQIGGREGNLQVSGINSSMTLLQTQTNNTGAYFSFGARGNGAGGAVVENTTLGRIEFCGYDGTDYQSSGAQIICQVDGTPGANDMPSRLAFSTTADGAASPTERMRITSVGAVLISKTTSNDTVVGARFVDGLLSLVRDNQVPLIVNRLTDDGDLVQLRQAGVTEGTISVSGTTVSYNGAHLSRWSQLLSGAERIEILRGSVLSNLDEMCEWGEEDNEQLNRMKVSDVEGDKNVSGVFQCWDDDDDTYTDDFYCAMTGDFIIRIAEGVTVERGDLLMSAGDGTAKPQDDDIIRSKTIAKVTSTNVSCTYDDGSYCVPCVLMAC